MEFASSKPGSFSAKYEEVEHSEVLQQRMKTAQAQPKLQTHHPEVCSATWEQQQITAAHSLAVPGRTLPILWATKH